MAWSSIIGQERVKRILQRTIAEGRVAHAYCFHGPEGIGKDALAIEFAKAVNCERPIVNDGGGREACDECSSCKGIAALTHPNFQLVFSLPAAKNADSKSDAPLLKLSDDQIEAIREQLRKKAENPYHNIDIANANQIRIAAIREVKKNISMSASLPGRRFVVVTEADSMNTEAANAFLKSLEEPSAGITIILTTSRKEQILPTILSRCQQVRCDLLDDNAIAEALVRRNSFSPEEASLLARLADGSYSVALENAETDVSELRSEIVDFVRAVLRRSSYIVKLSHAVDQLQQIGSNKMKLEKALRLLLLWLRDASVVAMTGNRSHVINIDQAEAIEKFALNFKEARYHEAIEAVERAITDIRRNVQISLALTVLALSLRKTLAPQYYAAKATAS